MMQSVLRHLVHTRIERPKSKPQYCFRVERLLQEKALELKFRPASQDTSISVERGLLQSDESKDSMNRKMPLPDAEMPRDAAAAGHAPPCLVEMNGL
jgi:hypothetical protein